MQLASALTYCHRGMAPKYQSGFFHQNMNEWKPQIHRNVKPSNGKLSLVAQLQATSCSSDTLLTQNTVFIAYGHYGELLIKLGDFGLSAVLFENIPDSHNGTARYLAPVCCLCSWSILVLTNYLKGSHSHFSRMERKV